MVTDQTAVVAIDASSAQLRRTAAWLRSLPLARFSQAGGAVEQQARALIEQVHRCTVGMCAELSSASAPTAADTVGCPPPDRDPDHLGVHALGDQLAVHAADLDRCARACLAAGVPVAVSELQLVSSAALHLRAGS